jgi:multidrug transporter EmrE-like cation transporter
MPPNSGAAIRFITSAPTFHLAFGVVCVALVSPFVLGEPLTARQLVGFALLVAGTVLIAHRP